MNIKKIGLISPLPPAIGGIATWTDKYLKWTKDKNIDVYVIDSSIIGRRKKNANKIIILDELKRYKKMKVCLKKLITAKNVEIIHFNTSCSKIGIIRDYFLVKLAIKKKVKVIMHFHCDVQEQIKFTNKIGLRYLKKILKMTSNNIVLNDKSFKYLSMFTNNVSIVPNFIEKSFVKSSSKIINKTIKKIIYYGHVSINKGIFKIIEISKKLPCINFEVIGPKYANIDKITIPSNLKIVEPLDKEELIQRIDESDLFLLISKTEGFSLSLLEAMSRGLPIIATNVGANFDMIEESGGYICEFNDDVDDISKLIKKMTYKERIDMSNFNICKVKNNYTVEAVMNSIIEIYREES